MKTVCSAILTEVMAATMAGCALNPLAEGDLYKRKNSQPVTIDTTQPSAIEINDNFGKADADNDGAISKQEAQTLSWLPVIFDSCDADEDGTLSWNEFTDAMQSRRVSRS